MDPVVAATLAGAGAGIAVSAVGWVVTYRLTLRAQAENTRQQLVNEARTDATAALNQAQHWLGLFNAQLGSCAGGVVVEKNGWPATDSWQAKVTELRLLLADARTASEWQEKLEDHASLFPEMTECRIQLGHRQRHITAGLNDLINALQTTLFTDDGIAKRTSVVGSTAELQQMIYDQQALFEDVKIHLQNYTLGKLTGKRIPLREVQDANLPRIVEGEAGVLRIVAGQNAPTASNQLVSE